MEHVPRAGRRAGYQATGADSLAAGSAEKAALREQVQAAAREGVQAEVPMQQSPARWSYSTCKCVGRAQSAITSSSPTLIDRLLKG
jgi:hypothetical protein